MAIEKKPTMLHRATDRWENEGGNTATGPTLAHNDLHSELKHHGITTVHLTVFDWGGYRYSNAGDAIAAAKPA